LFSNQQNRTIVFVFNAGGIYKGKERKVKSRYYRGTWMCNVSTAGTGAGVSAAGAGARAAAHISFKCLQPAVDNMKNGLVVQCELPVDARLPVQSWVPTHADISATLEKQPNTTIIAFANVPICNKPLLSPKMGNTSTTSTTSSTSTNINSNSNTAAEFFLSICTSVGLDLSGIMIPPHYLLQWVHYHLSTGVRHVSIYFDMPAQTMENYTMVLHEMIQSQQVTPIHFHFNYSQQYRENYCLHRYRGVSEWVGMLDVDEMFSPKRLKYRTLPDVLRAQPVGTTAIRFGNRYWDLNGKGGGRGGPAYDLTKYTAVDIQLRRERCKTIVKPMSATYM
jgi:hypothetical protein